MSQNTDRLIMEVNGNKVVIQLFSETAPLTAERLKVLAKSGFYDGIVFHRVIEGFMAQTGDPTGTGMGGSDLPDLPAEFSKALKFERGTVGMARSSDPNSGNSQFFICFDRASWLDGQYTVVGQVVSGMEYIDQIKKGDNRSGAVKDPDKITSLKPEEVAS